jgi:hypothetical protein
MLPAFVAQYFPKKASGPPVDLSNLEPLSADDRERGLAAFRLACEEFKAIRGTGNGRGNALNKLAINAAAKILRGVFDEKYARDAMWEAAEHFLKDNYEDYVARQIDRGLEHGYKLEPWEPAGLDVKEAFGGSIGALPAGALTGLPAAAGAQGGPLARGGDGFLNPAQQLTHFKGCVYIESQHRVLVPGGKILKPEVFKGIYGGFTFMLDSRNDKTTRDAFEALMQSQVNDPVITFGTCFKPLLPPGEIVTRNGQRFVNTYYPVNVDRKQGDASPFLDLLAKLLPDQRDRGILLAYMAAVVQHQGFKFQWAPFIQGVEGNGKSTLSRCVEQAVGERYTHWPKAKEVGNKFNAWMPGKVFYAVEDIYSPAAKNQILEDLKPMISGLRHEIEKKGVDQETADICGNFIFNSNHQDAIRKTKNDRRYCIFFTAQQRFEDLARDGMDGESGYFSKLHKWLEKDGGYAIVNEWLHTYPIPAEFNPAGDCNRAPITSTSHEAIAASLGGVEQDILEAVAEERQGFCGGWISSKYVRELPRAQRLTSQKLHQILEGLGYVPHPALKNGGRVDNPVRPDHSRSKLYIHRSNVALAQIASSAAIENNYETANQFALVNSAFGGGTYGN